MAAQLKRTPYRVNGLPLGMPLGRLLAGGARQCSQHCGESGLGRGNLAALYSESDEPSDVHTLYTVYCLQHAAHVTHASWRVKAWRAFCFGRTALFVISVGSVRVL